MSEVTDPATDVPKAAEAPTEGAEALEAVVKRNKGNKERVERERAQTNKQIVAKYNLGRRKK